MLTKFRNFVITSFLAASSIISQTNVQGTINTNTTWTKSGSPYSVTGSITVRDGATLTIESDVEVKFTTSSYITIGYSSSSQGTLNADGAVFTGMLSSDAKIYFKNNSSSGTLNNCKFDNTYLWIEKSEVTINNVTIDNCTYPILLEDGGKIIHSNLTLESNNQNYGIHFKGTISANYTISDFNIPFFIESLTISNGAVLTIESGSEIYFPTSTGMTIGSSSTSVGTLNADDVLFKGTSSSDSKIYFKSSAGNGTLENCTFDNSYLLIENTNAVLSNCSFLNCINPVIYEDAAVFNVNGLQFLSNVTYPGLGIKGNIKTDYTLTDDLSPYYIEELTIRDNATLSIESGSQIFFTSTNAINVGYSTSSIGHLIADGIIFKGSTTSDAAIDIRYNSTAQITNCTFNNAYINIDNSSPQITNSSFTKCVYAIQTRNNANPIISNNDFFNNTYALKNYGTNSIMAENNFWGDPGGPTNVNNPGGLGQKIEGTVDYLPFASIPYNGNINAGVLLTNIDFGEVVTGITNESTFKLVTSLGDVDLFISRIEMDNSAFTTTAASTYWLTNSDTLIIKIKFTPTTEQVYSGNLKLYNNDQGNSPIVIPIIGTGISPLSPTPTQLDFGLVDLKSVKTLPVILKNISTRSSVTIDSIKSTNPDFTFLVLSGTSNYLQFDESISEDVSFSINEAAGFSLSPGYSKEIQVTFNPSVRAIETGQLEIYYSGSKKLSIDLQGEGYASPLAVNITSLSVENFPFLFLNAAVDTFNIPIETLSKSNFEVCENGVLQTENFDVIKPGESGNIRLTDIVFIMDNSGSMGDEHTAVSNNVINFVNQLANSAIDYSLGLCRYGSSSDNGNPIIEDNGILTSDPNYFKDVLWERNIANGSKEPGYFAIKQSASSFNFRPGSQKIFIIITDENPDQGGASIDEALNVCVENKITLFVLTNSSLYSSFTPITSVTNGEIFDIRSDFGDIFDYISTTISSAYVIQYKSSEPIPNNFNREVVVKVNYNSIISSDTVYYNPGSIPRIVRTSNTLAFHNQAWIEGTAFKIEAIITDDIEPFVQSAILYYRLTGNTFFTSVQMVNEGNNIYSADIPSGAVNTPGVDYYITASDGNVSVSEPKLTPSQTPHQIAILPNVAPVIQHTIIESAERNTTINITADISDNTNSITDVKLFYRTIGQLIYGSSAMNLSSGTTYQSTVPSSYMTGSGVEYYIQATDNFGLSSFHGTSSAPHTISAVAASVPAVLDTLASAPSINKVRVPSNGTGYCYFSLYSNGNPVNSNGDVNILLTSGNEIYNAFGTFIRAGVLRIDIPNYLMISNQMNFYLGSGISVNDTFYTFISNPFIIHAEKINSPFNRTWTVFASGSAGVSGSAGSIGLGVSASAAKLSVKGTAGAGLEIKLDQDDNRYLGRRLEASLTAEVEAPKANLAVASATVASVSATVKTFFGQQFSFTGLGLSEDNVKMAEAGFLLETMSYAGIGLSPGAGAVLAAIIATLNAASGVYSMYDDGLVNLYSGFGLEGSVGAGFKAKFQSFEMNALNPSAGIALNLTLNNFNPDHPSITDNTVSSVKLAQSFSFSFSTLDFGLAANDKVSLSSGNVSLFDAGLGSEVSVEAKLKSGFSFNGMVVNLKGGGGINLFGGSSTKSYNTIINFPKEYLSALTNAGTSLIGLYTPTNLLSMGSDILTESVQTIKTAYGQVADIPIEVTTEEIDANGFDFSLGIELDVAVLLGVGVTFGVNGKYYDEVSYPRKYSEIYLNGNNYLIYSNEYSDHMRSANFSTTMQNMFSGVLPLITSALTNIFNTVEELVVAGQTFIIDVASDIGDGIGTIVGTFEDGGEFVISTFTSHLPSFYVTQQFSEPTAKKICFSKNVLHKSVTSGYNEYESNLVIFSRIMNVRFKKTGETEYQDTLSSPITVKMKIYPEELDSANLSYSDSSKIAMYVYDSELLNWIHLGGELVGDTLIAQTDRLGAFGLGIELNQINDNEAPVIDSYGPEQGSVWSTYPEIFVVVHDNKYGSGLDLVNSILKINGVEFELSFDPSTSKLFYQTKSGDIEKLATNNIEFVICDLVGNSTQFNYEFRANITGINDEQIVTEYSLDQNYPNPFNPQTKINFSIPKTDRVEISIYDIRGRFIKKLLDENLEAGNHTIEWDGTNNLGYKVASGVYFYKMKTDNYQVVKKMLLVK